MRKPKFELSAEIDWILNESAEQIRQLEENITCITELKNAIIELLKKKSELDQQIEQEEKNIIKRM